MIYFFRKHKFCFLVTAFSLITIGFVVCLCSVDRAINDKTTTYITTMGWAIEKRPKITHLTIPEDFDDIYQNYNSLQKTSGFDLSNYRGANATRYTYKITNHQLSQQNHVVANVIVYKGNIIAADVSSNSINGFMHPLTDTTYIGQTNEPAF